VENNFKYWDLFLDGWRFEVRNWFSQSLLFAIL